MGTWLERLVSGTRGQLLALLRRSKQSVNELAAAVGISDNAVRTHLGAMQRDGLVEEAGVQRSTGGKPAHLYQLTAQAEELFPKAYAFVLGNLLAVLEERQGRESALASLREVGRRAGGAGGAGGALSKAKGDPEARVEAAAAALRSLGGDVEVKRTDSGWELRGHGCPLSGIVANHPELCALAQTLVEEITGVRVTEACQREGRPRCSFHVPRRPARVRGARAAKE